jgi:hypothetical protein
MVLTAFSPDNPTPRCQLAGPAARLQAVGEIIQELYPETVLVSSDEDQPDGDTDLDDGQLELLEAIADHQRELLSRWQPRWA